MNLSLDSVENISLEIHTFLRDFPIKFKSYFTVKLFVQTFNKEIQIIQYE